LQHGARNHSSAFRYGLLQVGLRKKNQGQARVNQPQAIGCRPGL
jgi:hypothetical protein